MKLKICGIKRNEDAAYLNRYLPDYAGFIFYPKSKRFISKEEARRLKIALNNNIKTVGVFVDVPLEQIISYFRERIIDIAQLHGNETPQTVETLKEKGIPVVKAIRIESPTSFEKLKEYNPDYFLFDFKDDNLVGGTGKSFNWDYLKSLDLKTPYFLAGGINQSNIDRALQTDAYALDISTGVERYGVKNEELIKNIVEKVRNFDKKISN